MSSHAKTVDKLHSALAAHAAIGEAALTMATEASRMKEERAKAAVGTAASPEAEVTE